MARESPLPVAFLISGVMVFTRGIVKPAVWHTTGVFKLRALSRGHQQHGLRKARRMFTIKEGAKEGSSHGEIEQWESECHLCNQPPGTAACAL